MLTHWREKLPGVLRRLTIWVILLTIWESAYRVIGWRSYIFPAPAQVLDSTLGLMGFSTGFGEPFFRQRIELKDGTTYTGTIVQQGNTCKIHVFDGEERVVASSDIARFIPLPRWPAPIDPSSNSHPFFSRILLSPFITANTISGLRLIVGFILSVALGTLLGAAMWRWLELDNLLGPLFLGLQTLPSVCWVPLSIILFGFEETSIMFVLVMGSAFGIAVSMRDGLRTIPPLYHRAGLMLGAAGWRMYRYVLFPAGMPALASSLRQGFSFAWRSLMGAELILESRRHGLGFLLHNGENNSDIAQVVSIMIVMVIVGIVADRLVFGPLEKRVHKRFGLAAH